MNFFWTTTAGMLDLIGLGVTIAVAARGGNSELRKATGALCVSYLLTRIGLAAFHDERSWAAALSVVDVVVIASTLSITRSVSAKLFCGLFVGKIAAYSMGAAGIWAFMTCADLASVFMWLQFAMIWTGASGNGVRNRRVYGGRPVPRYRRVADLAFWTTS
jgi:hypothetical protein